MNDEERVRRIDALVNIDPQFGRKAREAVEKICVPGKTPAEVHDEIDRVLGDFESGAGIEHERVVAARLRQVEADRQSAARIAHDRALEEARVHPKTAREIVRTCEAIGIHLEVDELGRIVVSGDQLTNELFAQIEVNREGVVEYLRQQRTVTQII